MMAVCEMVADTPSNTACLIVPRMATMNAAIIVLLCPGSKPCSAPSRIAPGMNNQALPCAKYSLNEVMLVDYTPSPYIKARVECFQPGGYRDVE